MIVTTLIPDGTGLVDWPTLSTQRKAVVTVGEFDGMHLGHRAVIERTVALARATRSYSVVIMFDPRPSLVHRYADDHDGQEPGSDMKDPAALTSVHQRLRVMRGLGVDHVLVVHYSLAFAAKSFRFFLGQLVGKLGMRTLVLGADAAMGAHRSGDITAISALAQATGVFELDVVNDRGPGYVRVPQSIIPQPPTGPGEPQDPALTMTKAELRAWSKTHQTHRVRSWSSTHVRYLLSQGRIRSADEILGEPHAVEGMVVHGEQRGRTIGFPTANLGGDIEGYIPVDGVYAGWLIDMGAYDRRSLDDRVNHIAMHPECNGMSAAFVSADAPSDEIRMSPGSQWRWPAAISIGTKPTYSKETGIHERVIEPYAITDDWLELYGHKVRVEFRGFLSPQIAFDGTQQLRQAMRAWTEETLDLVGGESMGPKR